MKYDYLIVGAGFFGSVFAHEAKQAGKRVLVVDKRPHIGGNVYTENIEGIHVHKYGAHIFHTNLKHVWDYVNQFAVFNRFTNSPVANYHGELYSLPFNMYTFNKMWGVVTPEEAAAKIEEQKKAAGIINPRNLEEQAISLVGMDIYEKADQGIHGKAVGAALQGTARLHYQAPAGTADLRQQLFQCALSGDSGRRLHEDGRKYAGWHRGRAEL